MSQSMIYTTNTDSDDISVVDVATQKEVTRIEIGGSPRGSVRITNDGTTGYVSNTAGDTISVLDLERNIEKEKIKVGCSPRGLVLSPDNTLAFVSNSGENNLSILDLSIHKEVRKVDVGKNPRHSGVTPDGRKVIVSVWGEDKIAILESQDFINGEIETSFIDVGVNACPYSVAISKSGQTAYVANTQANYISVIDLETKSLRDNIEVGYGSRAIAIGLDANEIYVTVENSNEIAVVSLIENRVIRTIPVGPNPRGITISPEGDILYSVVFTRDIENAPFARNSITVVERETGKFLNNILVGLGPCSVAIKN